MELLLLARAEAEVLETQARLEDAVAGLGERFNLRVGRGVGPTHRIPQSGSVYTAPFRRVLVRDFPFGIFYSIEGRRIVVQAVLDLRQDPQAIERKLRGA